MAKKNSKLHNAITLGTGFLLGSLTKATTAISNLFSTNSAKTESKNDDMSGYIQNKGKQIAPSANPIETQYSGLLDSNNGYTYRNDYENFNSIEAQKERDWSERMSNTSLQRLTADAKAAGINPIYAVGSGGAASYTGASASSSASMDIARLQAQTQLAAQKIASNSAVKVANIGASATRDAANTNGAWNFVRSLL